MHSISDQMGNILHLPHVPRKVVSIVPSQSEFIWDIGGKDQLAGITKFCIHPEKMFREIRRVGGTKNLNLSLIRQIQPDIIIGNKEENDQNQVEELKKEFNVWMSDIHNINDAVEMMSQVGKILGREPEANNIINEITFSFKKIRSVFTPLRVAYFIWKDPYMLAAKNTFIDSIITLCGLINISEDNRYPEYTADEIKALKPDLCFLSSEPYPFNEQHVEEIQNLFPYSRVMIVDGEMFSWYGSRLLKTPDYLLKLKEEISS
jgi:ABC-type Fe3+-hydroxamate transport system substrate-binding protein